MNRGVLRTRPPGRLLQQGRGPLPRGRAAVRAFRHAPAARTPRLRGGNAVNFLHGASVGPFIFLVQAEILAALHMLTRGNLAPGTHDVSAADRAVIADAWLTAFNR